MLDVDDVGLVNPDENRPGQKTGGIGLSPALFDLEKDLLRHSLKTINVCPCQEGCPSCVGPSRETGRQAKQVAQEILRGLLEA